MADRLETQYENELAFIRRMGADFAKDRPKIADRLLLDHTGATEDPHVERLIEAFAFLTARIRVKIEDQLPELTEALLGVLYPHYLAPIPSMAIVEFEVDPAQGKLTSGHVIPRHSQLYTREVKGIPCRFRTTTPVKLWPINVKEAVYETAPFGHNIQPPLVSRKSEAMIHLTLQTRGAEKFSTLQLDSVRFYLNNNDQTVHTLYEALLNDVSSVVLMSRFDGDEEPIVLPPECLKPVGFEREDGMLPYPPQSFLGYQLLTDYFAFPQKFFFVDLAIGEALEQRFGSNHKKLAEFRENMEVLMFLNEPRESLQPQIDTDTFKLGCAPIVNLFDHSAEPISVSQTKTEYKVIPDIRFREAFEVYSISEVGSIHRDTGEDLDYEPFFSIQHRDDRDQDVAFWYMHRRPSVFQNDAGTDVFLTLVNIDFDAMAPPSEVLTVKTVCSNRDLPGTLRATGGADWHFQLQGQAPLRRITPIVLPTNAARLPLEETRWRLISHLALNHLSITGGEDGAEALRELLRLYDFGGNRANIQHIEGVSRISSRRCVAPIQDGSARGFCRGIELTLQLDEDKFVGAGPFLLASVLDRFFAMYVSINSFTRTVVRLQHQDRELRRFTPRSGTIPLI